MHSNGENGKLPFDARMISEIRQMDRRYMFMQSFVPGSGVSVLPQLLYTCI